MYKIQFWLQSLNDKNESFKLISIDNPRDMTPSTKYFDKDNIAILV